jgi:isopenicillin-N epimerase
VIDSPLVPLAAYALDPDIVHVNHGSFGACTHLALDAQHALRTRLEAAPTRFFVIEWEGLLDAARDRLAAFVGADPAGLAFVPNTTTAVSTVLASLTLGAGDELIATDHTYGACRNALDAIAARSGARVVVARIPFPLTDPAQAAAAIVDAVTPRTRLALIDHVSSATSLVFDVAAIATALAARGVAVLVDGAHAPGQVDLDVAALAAAGVSYYAGNCHKWLCAPKGSAFLWVDADRRKTVRPLTTSHGVRPGSARSRYWSEHDWTGSHDPTSFLSVPAAIDAGVTLAGSWPRIRDRNHRLALAARDAALAILGGQPPAPDAMVGSMVTLPVRLPPGVAAAGLERQLLTTGWEIPILDWPGLGMTSIRISSAAYNKLADAEAIARHLRELGVVAA